MRRCALLLLVALVGCGQDAPPSPFQSGEGGADAGTDADASVEGGVPSPGPVNPALGGPCAEGSQCDDELDCTEDSCDEELGRCRYAPISARCADDVYCDGIEICVPGLGCQEGEPVSCSDQTTCTIDLCVEASRSCETSPRDADADGDPVWNCGGSDCDDTDPRVNAAAPEVCANEVDDDCDAEVDEESECTSPEYDTCADPLVIEASGIYPMSLAAAADDLGVECGRGDPERRDVIAALVVPEGEALDVDVSVEGPSEGLALSALRSCSDPSSLLGCVAAVAREEGGSVARLILRQLEPGTYPIVITGLDDETANLKVNYELSPPEPTNDTCSTAATLAPGQNVQVTLAGPKHDLRSVCQSDAADVVYRFELTRASDVQLSALSLDDFGVPLLSLRTADCTPLESELTCRKSSPATLFERAVPAGTYYAVVGSSGPTDVDLRLDLEAATQAPEGEGCASPPELRNGVSEEQNLARRADAVNTRCMPGAADATFALELEDAADVLVVERLSAGDSGAVSLLGASCRGASELGCTESSTSPVRTRADAVPAGEYRVVAESATGSPIVVTAFTRPPQVTTLVPFADSCEDALLVTEMGGRFVGNTSNANPDYEASCDFGGGPVGGAPEQMLLLRLPERRRVVLDAAGSDYQTLLVVRRAAGCPGTELDAACSPAADAAGSFLDLSLPKGDYFVQIDGYNRASGHWILDVFTAPNAE